MINSVVIMGRLTAQPELKTTTSGIEVLSFTIAVDKYAKQGEEKKADFIDCTAWRQTAVFIDKYFNKGQMIAVEGAIQTRMYEDKNGNKRKATEVVVNNASFCGSKSDSNGSVSVDTAPSNDAEINEEDLPF